MFGLSAGAEHAQQQLEQALSGALKAASAAAGCTPAVWGLYAEYYRCAFALATSLHLGD